MAGPHTTDAWSPALEDALLRQLVSEFHEVNQTCFGGLLRAPVVRLTDTRLLGRWISAQRTLELSRAMTLERPWGEVVEVLRHEIAHQYVDEVLGIQDEPPHGPTFRRVCADRGIDARAAGRPDAAAGDPVTARLVEKVRRLFALAGSENQHEAELAMRRAHELMLRHQLELDGVERHYVFRHIGKPHRRKSLAESLVAGLLAEHFFVEVIWTHTYVPFSGQRARVLEICGTEENVAMAEYVHEFLLQTAERLWHEARRSRAELVPGDRASFMAGVVFGFRDKLRDAKREHQGAGLVWVGDADLLDYYRRRHPRIRRRAAGRTTRAAARSLGHQEGRKVVLHRPIESRAGAGRAPRLLRS